MSLDEEIAAAAARLKCPGTDVESVLRTFASKAGVTERVVEKHTCSSCGEEDVLCFRCKAQATLGEQATMALPILLPKLAAMAKQWASEALAARAAKRAAEAQAAAQAQQARRAQAPPPPAGKQVF